MKLKTIVVGLSTVATLACSSPQQQAKVMLNDLKRDVALDLAEQYAIVEKTGTPMEQCVQAGVVKAAYLQAKNQFQYDVWTAVETIDCEKAGIKK